jgi:hypothetical protein
MQTDKSGAAGPRSTREPVTRFRQPERREHERENSNGNIQVPPTVPSFGFQLPMLNGTLPFAMPPGVAPPPGYGMVMPTQTQPPPPGTS